MYLSNQFEMPSDTRLETKKKSRTKGAPGPPGTTPKSALEVIACHGINSLQNPAFFVCFFFFGVGKGEGILAFFRIYEVPTFVMGNTTDLYDLLNTFKENGGLSETKTKQNGGFSR